MVRNIQTDSASQAALNLLKERAARAGVTLSQFIGELENIGAIAPARNSRAEQGSAEWLRQLHDWASSHPRLTQEADDRRESIYPDRV